jgi:hypothetical protein
MLDPTEQACIKLYSDLPAAAFVLVFAPHWDAGADVIGANVLFGVLLASNTVANEAR